MTLKTLENALDVLSYFTNETPEWGLRDLARAMEMNHTVLNRILKTFEKKGYLIQNDQTKKYELGLRFMEFSSIIRQRMRLSEFVLPVMKELAELVNEAVFLTLKDEKEGVTVEIADCQQPIRYTVSIGTRTPLHVGASCKSILAFLPLDEQEEIMNEELKAFTQHTTIDAQKLIEELQTIRSQGRSYTRGEFAESVTGVGVPLFNRSKEVIGSITIAGPTYRISASEINYFVDELKNSMKTIQRYFEKFGMFYN